MYRFALAKPNFATEEALGISQELVIVFSPYKSFEARSLEAFSHYTAEITDQRYERMCYALISDDNSIEEVIKQYLTNQEDQVVVPFSYQSFADNKANQHFIRNQFRNYFYSRDLFDYSEPLKKDIFFFGRSEIVTQIISKHHQGQNCGWFGLRKTGKTSIIYDVLRKSKKQGYISALIDCQDTSFNLRRWNEALYYVILTINSQFHVYDSITEAEFTEKDASTKFKEYIVAFNRTYKKKLLLIFDEIENITYGKSAVNHWSSEMDFAYFWQSIRTAFQTTDSVFTFCIFGTNPKCIEDANISKAPNPIYNMIQPYYIPGFDHDQTREMVRKLGRIMGISFDEEIYSKLVEDYGGHPFLVRRVCSRISQMNPNRPVTIDRRKYKQAKEAFNLENTYFEMILGVLEDYYKDELEMLKLLAIEDNETFYYYAREDRSMLNHLVGYGLIKECDGYYDFKLDAIKDYLIRKRGDHIILLSDAEKWSHLCVLRNSLEVELRKMVKQVLRFAHKNEVGAKDYVVSKVFKGDKRSTIKTYNDLFDSKKSLIFLKNLTSLINSDWEYFEDYFGNQDVFNVHMKVLNDEGRFDAHAKKPDDATIHAVENSVKYISEAVDKFNQI